MLDWINTIDNPACLLVSSVDELYDGKIFYEIIKLLLFYNNNTYKDWIDFGYAEIFFVDLLLSCQGLIDLYQSQLCLTLI